MSESFGAAVVHTETGRRCRRACRRRPFGRVWAAPIAGLVTVRPQTLPATRKALDCVSAPATARPTRISPHLRRVDGGHVLPPRHHAPGLHTQGGARCGAGRAVHYVPLPVACEVHHGSPGRIAGSNDGR